MLNATEIYVKSDGKRTEYLYTRLQSLGPVGDVALNLFRAQKCSARAKVYRGTAVKNSAYGRKAWSMGLLCGVLVVHARALNIQWGWKADPNVSRCPWVLYVDLPTGVQVSFHSTQRGVGPDYSGQWDGVPDVSAQRIVGWVQKLINEKGLE